MKDATPLTCLTLEYVRDLATMAQAEEAGKLEARLSNDEVESALYVMKTRMNAEKLIRQRLIEYRGSPARPTATAGRYASNLFRLFYAWDSTAEANLRRIASFKSSVTEMQELLVDQKEHGDEPLKLMFAVAGELLDQSLIEEGPSVPITKRRMTTKQRDQIVTEIEHEFAGHLTVE